jgi:hypothetical protein
LFDDAKAKVAAKIRLESQKGLNSDDPVEQAGARYAERMINLFDQRVQLVREGDHIVIARGNIAGEGSAPTMSVATAGILIALLLPAVQAAREAARRNVSANNMKQLLLGLLNYESAHGAFPANANYGADGKPLLSWRVHILPYLEQGPLYEQFHLDEPWDSEHNRQLIPMMPALFLDPSSPLPATEGKTHYVGVTGESYSFTGNKEGRQLRSVSDGTANTILLVQVGDAAAATWTKPDDWTPDDSNLLKPFVGPHPGGFWAGFMDGHVQFISSTVDPKLFKSLLTIKGGEVVQAF